jgi:hypothetical protein
MRDSVTIIRERQLAIRREMDRRGIALKQVEFDSDIPYATLLSYFPAEGSREPAVIPASAIYKLAEGKALPNDLLSLLLPAGFAIVRIPEGIDHDALCEGFQDYLTEKAKAHRPDSPAGRDIADCERELLDNKVVHLPLGRVA